MSEVEKKTKTKKYSPNWSVRVISYNNYATIYSISPGWFGVGTNSFVPRKTNIKVIENVSWHSCRERFHSSSNNIYWFLFSHTANKGKNIALFIHKIEEQLQIKTRTTFGETQTKTVSWIKLSPWWLVRPMKRSLFTALLRAGQNYKLKTDNFAEAMDSQPYLRNTKTAVNHFFKGNTVYTGSITGWYEQFYNSFIYNKKLDLEKLLKKPKSKTTQSA